MSTRIDTLSIKLGEKTIELTADEARRLYDFLHVLLAQDAALQAPVLPAPVVIPIILKDWPQLPQWPNTRPWFGDPIQPGPTCGSPQFRCLNASL